MTQFQNQKSPFYFSLKTLFLLSIFISLTFSLQAQFSKVAGAKGLDHTSSGNNNNGHAWGDVDNDGDLDVIMHVGNGGSSTKGKLYLNSGSPNYTFTDVTTTKIDGFDDAHNFGRQMLIVDFNNDGYNDILRGFGSSIDTEIYYNDGPPNYTFGNGSQQPDVLIGAPAAGNHNTEGIAAIDWNQDGWLDLVIDNDDGGNDIYENDQAGGFVYQTPGTGTGQTGFAASHSGDGDYLTVADIDDDGYVDMYGRKTAVNNYWHFNPITGQFETQATPDITSSETDKGGTMFCDFDNDGDLDLLWTSFGKNQIWRNDGGNTWVATEMFPIHVEDKDDIDGCDCGDYDNDGDLDVILGTSSGFSYLMKNAMSGGSLSFELDSISTSDDTESATFTDYDNDGDLDIYFVVTGGANQLWENSTNNTNYLYVNALFDNGSTSRDAIGANVFLTNCAGDTTGLRQVNGGKGHGSQHQKKVHFGLDPNLEYIVEVHYVYDSTTMERTIVKKAVVPSYLPNQEVSILNTDASEVFYCQDTDTDGALDYIDLDDDNDGIPDVSEDTGTGFDPHGDADSDGILNVFDDNDVTESFPTFIDSNGDGLNDAYDSDKDGLPDYIDLDGDNDGIPDIVEAGGTDENGDGLVDYPTPNDPGSMVDLDNDGLADAHDDQNSGAGGSEVTGGTPLANSDSDNDGLKDALDLDADNDGIPDLVEVGGIDENGDGLVDTDTDIDQDGLADIYDENASNGPGGNGTDGTALVETDGTGKMVSGFNATDFVDTDGDNLPDHLDLDADNDGIPDIIEAGGSTPNNDGMVDVLAAPWDSDNDGLADIYDENNLGIALVETTSDTNGDGKVNATESMSSGGSNLINIDGDSYPNHLDLDADNDGITDVVENAGGAVSADHSSGTLDGIVGNNATVTDTDNNGWHDPSNTSTTDSDGDGIPDFLDIDPDSNPTDANENGVLDIYESLTSANATGGSNIGTSPNVDDDSGNTTPDYLDTDTDDDGANDWTEGYDLNNNGQAADDLQTMAANYETATSNNYYLNATDTDADGIPDWLDNQPAVAGYDEAIRPPFLNQASSFWHDDDNDGLVDLLDSSQSGTDAPTPDNNGGNDLDWRDMTTVARLPVELSDFYAKEKDCMVELNWITQSEVDFDYFEIQWSGDGHDFARINWLTNNENTNGGNYKILDKNPSATNYYRLKMVDLDGTFEFSKVVFIKLDCPSLQNDVNIFPNPLFPSQPVNIEFLSKKGSEQIIVIDMLGRIVKRVTLETEEGKNKIELDISDLSVGNYLIQIVGSEKSKMLMIQE